MCKWANSGIVTNVGIHGTRAFNRGVRAHDAINEARVWSDLASCANARMALQHCSGIQRDVAIDLHININKSLTGIKHGDAIQ
jgi:hypothetical protein